MLILISGDNIKEMSRGNSSSQFISDMLFFEYMSGYVIDLYDIIYFGY